MPLDVNRIQGIIWDLDNTLYRFTDAFYHACTKAAAEAAKELGIDLSYDETLRLAERSESEHGFAMHGYVTDHGLSYASLHFPFHQKIDEGVIAPIAGLKSALQSLELPKVILTNSSRCWAERVLKYTQLDDFFESHQIIPLEDVDFKAKAQTNKGFKKAVEILDLPPENIMMVDDLDRNLIFPHDMGLQTAYLHYGDAMGDLPDFIDGQFYGAIDVIKALKK